MGSKQQKQLVVPPGEGKQINVLGDIVTIKIKSDETNGTFSLVEEVSAPQGGPPFHVHQQEDEMFYILEGECEVRCGNQTFRAIQGSIAVLPRNVPHGFRNIGSTPSKVLITITPGGFEKFFEEMGQLPSDGPPDMQKIIALAQKYKVQIMPPSGTP